MERLLESLQTALEMEQRGREFYLQAASRAKDTIVESVLVALADDELSHERTIKEYYRILVKHRSWPRPEDAPQIEGPPDRVERLLSETIGRIGPDATFSQVYETAHAMEIRSREYYQTQAKMAEEPRAVQFFNFLASIEHIHARTLETVLDAIRRASRS